MAARTSLPPPALGPDTRIAVLVGPERWLQLDWTRRLRDALRQARGQVETVLYDGNAPAADVLDECRTLGLLQHHKLVVVDDADQFVRESNRPIVERYAAAPADSATLLLRCTRWHRGRLDRLIAQVGAIVPCETMDERSAAVWAMERCRSSHHARLSRAAAEALIQRVGTDLGRLDGELAKLSLEVGSGGEVTAELVEARVGQSREQAAWAVQEALLSGRAEVALAGLCRILESSPRDACVPVSWSIMDLGRKLHVASRALRARVPPGEVAKVLRLWGPSRDRILSCARAMEPATAAELLRLAVEADAAQKSGLGRPQRILERVAIRFASAIGPADDSR